MSIDTLLAILNIEKGKVPGTDKDAPANKSYYLSCEHFDEETERASWHKTNADEVVKEFKQALNLYTEEKIKEELEQVVRVGLPYAKIRIKELEG